MNVLAQIPDTTIVDLVRIIPNGAAVTAVIIVVYLFLQQQDKYQKAIQEMSDRFSEQITLNQKAFQDQINALSQQYFTNQKAFQDQTQMLIDSHLKVSQETVSALKSLEAAVRVVQEKVMRLS